MTHYFDVPYMMRNRWKYFVRWLCGPFAYHRWRNELILFKYRYEKKVKR